MAPAATLSNAEATALDTASVATTTATSLAASSAATLAPHQTTDAEEAVLIVGGGLAGLTAAYELTQAGKKVVIVDQENEANLGGQAFWSLGGIFLVDSKEQRRFGVRDSYELARKDWFNSAQFDRPERDDRWAIQWAEEYLKFASGPMREYLTGLGMSFTTVGWAERGSGSASGHGK